MRRRSKAPTCTAANLSPFLRWVVSMHVTILLLVVGRATAMDVRFELDACGVRSIAWTPVPGTTSYRVDLGKVVCGLKTWEPIVSTTAYSVVDTHTDGTGYRVVAFQGTTVIDEGFIGISAEYNGPLTAQRVPIDLLRCAGTPLQLAITVDVRPGPIEFTWLRNGTAFAITSTPGHSFQIAETDHGAVFSVIIRTACEQATVAWDPISIGSLPDGPLLTWIELEHRMNSSRWWGSCGCDWPGCGPCGGPGECSPAGGSSDGFDHRCGHGDISEDWCRPHAASSWFIHPPQSGACDGCGFGSESNELWRAVARVNAPLRMTIVRTDSGDLFPFEMTFIALRLNGAEIRRFRPDDGAFAESFDLPAGSVLEIRAESAPEMIFMSGLIAANCTFVPNFIDCNGNGLPDGSDVASGSSTDVDGNLEPDECQTVSVPGDFATIQAAIDAAPADEMRIVAVAAGVHAGPVAFLGKPVVVRGAGAGQTVISGTGGQQVSVVRFMGGEPAISALERVTVTGGTTGTPLPGFPTALAGGGVLGIDAATSIRDCVIESNAAGFGGGIYQLRCSGEVRNCTIRGNTASTDGGGLQMNAGTVRVTDCVVELNACNSRGGGVHLVQGTPVLTRVTVAGNTSSNLMGGVSWFASGSPTALLALDSCAVTGNNALLSYGGIGITDAGLAASSVTLQGSTACSNLPRPNIGGGRWTDLGGNTVCDCNGDLNLDGTVNGADLGLMLATWGPCSGNCAYDLNADGLVNGADLGLLLAAWGPCGG